MVLTLSAASLIVTTIIKSRFAWAAYLACIGQGGRVPGQG